ncbi:hypothetical protein DPEC_G00158380 [Dallia pectoralis]|uniref:Uncharacterized protein n=1 Tax=Dallia pectoralis TaxID=75939 RepID=A0ACC2GLB8_DALPE|nr:hypothetical protein DPEC_G00158380 [Dallia pectoralis]
MGADVPAFIAACVACNQNKTSRHELLGLLQPLPRPHRPWSYVPFWFSSPASLPLTHFIPLPKLPSAKETAVIMVQHVVHIHGLPVDVASSRFWRAFCTSLEPR